MSLKLLITLVSTSLNFCELLKVTLGMGEGYFPVIVFPDYRVCVCAHTYVCIRMKQALRFV